MSKYKRLIAGMVVALVIAGGAVAHGAYAALEQIAVAGTAVGFTPATIREGNGHPQANKAICTVATATVVVRWDGGTPTSTVGHTLYVGTTLMLDEAWQLVNFKAIRATATSGQLDCTVSE